MVFFGERRFNGGKRDTLNRSCSLEEVDIYFDFGFN